MLSEQIESILTEGEQGWNLYTDKFSDNDVIADPFSSFTCPIAKYLEFRTGITPQSNYAIGVTCVMIIEEKVSLRLPEWAEKISCLSFRHGKNFFMTKGQLNKILQKYAK